MKLIIGKHAGFCFGVRRAAEEAFACARDKKSCVTLGPLIHNPQEVARLKKEGIPSVETLEEVQPGKTVIIRSHGVAPDIYEEADKRGIPIIDLTCPHVAWIHNLVKKETADGTALILVGEAEHPEMKGIAGWAGGQVIVLNSEEEAHKVDIPEKAIVIAQTTIRQDRYEAVLRVLEKKNPNIRIYNTICKATGLRQQEAEELSQSVQVMVVVGGKNSSNTNKLFETCHQRCPRSILVETPEDIPEGFICAEDTVALTAGASTPQWLLDKVAERITQMGTR